MLATCYINIHCRLTLYSSCTISHEGPVIASEKCFLLSKNCSFAILLQSMYHKHSHQIICKKLPHQQCHIKEQYAQQWKNYKSQIQRWTKIKYKNWYFSWLMHGVLYVSIQTDQKKKYVNIMKIHMQFMKFPLPHLRVQLVHRKS